MRSFEMERQLEQQGKRERLLKYFDCNIYVSKEFYGVAHNLVENDVLDSDQLMVALQKLLEAKDAAVRSVL